MVFPSLCGSQWVYISYAHLQSGLSHRYIFLDVIMNNYSSPLNGRTRGFQMGVMGRRGEGRG